MPMAVPCFMKLWNALQYYPALVPSCWITSMRPESRAQSMGTWSILTNINQASLPLLSGCFRHPLWSSCMPFGNCVYSLPSSILTMTNTVSPNLLKGCIHKVGSSQNQFAPFMTMVTWSLVLTLSTSASTTALNHKLISFCFDCPQPGTLFHWHHSFGSYSMCRLLGLLCAQWSIFW